MKKKNIINLIKYHIEKNELMFRKEVNEISLYFDKNNDHELAMYILSLVSDYNNLLPQEVEFESSVFERINLIDKNEPLFLPNSIQRELIGIINAINHNIGMNKFLFEGYPGTGKTEAVKQIARVLKRELFYVDFSEIIDSKMGETSKNISKVFAEINKIENLEKCIFIFDEIDSIAMNRIDSNDVREMGRVTSKFLKEFDNLNDSATIFATTNLITEFDKAFLRRFDSIINFDKYTVEELIEISFNILEIQMKSFPKFKKNKKLFMKLMKLKYENEILYPGDLKNYIRTSLAFSNSNDDYGYLRKICEDILMTNNLNNSLSILNNKGFTLREIEILTDYSKSKISRDLRGDFNE